MKVKKARKRLKEVEEVLTELIEKCGKNSEVKDLLGNAKTAVANAMAGLPESDAKAAASPKARKEQANTTKKRPTTAKASAAGSSMSKAG